MSSGLPYYITVGGCSRSISGWARQLGVTKRAITERLRLGWTEEDAVTRPPGKCGKLRHITANGCTKTLSEWARCSGLHDSTIARRLDVMGWSPDDAINMPPKSERD